MSLKSFHRSKVLETKSVYIESSMNASFHFNFYNAVTAIALGKSFNFSVASLPHKK